MPKEKKFYASVTKIVTVYYSKETGTFVPDKKDAIKLTLEEILKLKKKYPNKNICSC